MPDGRIVDLPSWFEHNESGRNLDTIREESRTIPVAADVDVCVVGGSCTGVFAAVAAARLGAQVAVVELHGFFGGTATAGLVNIWHSLLDTRREKQIIAGLSAEVLDRLKTRDAAVLLGPGQAHAFNSEELKIELDNLIVENGVRPFLHARFVAPFIEDGELKAVIIEDKSGRRAIRARQFVDASGDGDLVHRMGLECCKGDDLQPPTTCAIIRGLGEVKRLNPGFSLNQAVFNRKYPGALEQGFLWSSQVPGAPDERMVAGTRVNRADCSDADQLTAAEIEGRRQIRAICDILRDNFPGGRAVSPAALPASIGVRETRRARCLHRLTEEEVLTGKDFPDAVANGSYRVDIHHNDREGITLRYLDGTEEYVKGNGTCEKRRWRPEQPHDPSFYQIPYRSLVPREARNVLVAGRIIDTDKGAFGAARVMINCNQTGEAAGTAAYLALDSDKPVAEIPPDELRRTLKNHGALIV